LTRARPNTGEKKLRRMILCCPEWSHISEREALVRDVARRDGGRLKWYPGPSPLALPLPLAPSRAALPCRAARLRARCA